MKEKIKSSFDNAAKTYDSVAQVHVLSSAKLVSMLGSFNLRPKTILDIGCGTGNTSVELKKLYPHAEYTLCDISKNMINQALLKIPNAKHIVCDAEKHNFGEHYDLVVSNLAMQWFESIDEFLGNMLKKCRYFAFSTLLDRNFSDYGDLFDEWSGNYPSLQKLKNIVEKHGKLLKSSIERYDLLFESQFGAARYLKTLGAAPFPTSRNITQKLNTRRINLNYEVVCIVVRSDRDTSGVVVPRQSKICLAEVKSSCRLQVRKQHAP
ncbi:MAG: methyltransferase domain-containing protein [Holosporaceae bacterium]|jgi:malonyl-ACP O-methyltransferase BioC|nr:methyltransferase domain-containing protein [Holosporaceae bacterium]